MFAEFQALLLGEVECLWCVFFNFWKDVAVKWGSVIWTQSDPYNDLYNNLHFYLAK